jgi:undecaprenyl-diphosphatase
VKITPERLDQVEGYFERHGGKTILVGRFIGLVRALAPFVAGSSGFAYRRFIPYSVVGAGLWASLYCVLGYVFWQSFDRVAALAGQALLGFGIVVGLVVGAVVVTRKLRNPAQRRRLDAWLDRQEQRRVVGGPLGIARGLARRVAGVAASVYSLELIELTTALAIAGVGAYVCVLLSLAIASDPGPTALDQRALDLAAQLHTVVAVDVLKLVTALGSFPATATLLVVAALALHSRGRRAEPAVLVGGFLLVYAGVQLMKAGFDRPRPPGSLVGTLGAAFPSGHAAYATAWVAAAVALSSQVRLAGRAGLVLGGLAVAAVIGLSRVYLRAHWLSDVAAGWGLGFAIFGMMAALALIVGHIRHNGAPWSSASRPSRSPSP